MYDHKFRQSDLSFGRPPRRRRRLWPWVFGLSVALAALYGVTAWQVPDVPAPQDPIAGPNVIPLELPPKAAGE
jgi:hypothetical protein